MFLNQLKVFQYMLWKARTKVETIALENNPSICSPKMYMFFAKEINPMNITCIYSWVGQFPN